MLQTQSAKAGISTQFKINNFMKNDNNSASNNTNCDKFFKTFSNQKQYPIRY